MKNFQFDSDECLEIVNEEQFNEARHLLRNPNMEWKHSFPIYFEHAESMSRGSSIGIILSPVGTWTRQPLKVVSFNEAFLR
jgi:hypothetical protein